MQKKKSKSKYSHFYSTEFAVTTNSKILFYDANWTEITAVTSNKFSAINTIALDERDDTLYFNDQDHGTILSLRLADDDHHNIKTLVNLTSANNKIQSLTFDPLDRNLYWTDSKSRKIYTLNVDAAAKAPSSTMTGEIWQHLNDDEHPKGIAVDVCGRMIYWTNSNRENATIQRAPLGGGGGIDDGGHHQVIVKDDMDMPDGIVVDQHTQQIFWVDDFYGAHYGVERAALNGTNRQQNIRNMYKVPLNLAVDKRFVYWTDTTESAVWKVGKDEKDGEGVPEKVKDFSPLVPRAIIIRENFLLSQMSNPVCRPIVKRIMVANKAAADVAALSAPPAAVVSKDETKSSEMHNEVSNYVASSSNTDMLCLNKGIFSRETGNCNCLMGYRGRQCEIPICHNYCVKGSCYVSTTGYAECKCTDGYEGERCEIFKCTGYCLNDGRCELEGTDPVCHCLPTFRGRHCEHYKDENIVLEGINVSVCKK